MAKIEMYTKFMCPFCIRAKSLLKSKGVKVIDIPAASDARVSWTHFSRPR